MQETIDLKARLFQALSQSGAMDLQALSSFLNLEAATLQPLLQDLCREGQLVLTRKGRYAYPSQLGLVTGVVQGHRRGFGFLIRSDGEPDLYIASDAMNGALNGDTVLARPLPGERRECEVQTVLARANEVLVGRFELDGADGFVVPDDGRICVDIRIPQRDAGSAKDGDKVLARITRYGSATRSPAGRVLEVLGRSGEPRAELLSLIRLHHLSETFPHNVQDEAARTPQSLDGEDLSRRLDLRAINCFTIDGRDARDFDDAVSIEETEEGWRLGVHIADVSHYVRRGSLLDAEALKRGTSVYFPGLVLPMLPEELSNGICSLNPGVDRLTLSCIMDVDRQGQLLSYAIEPSVIRSKARLVYEDVSRALEGGDRTGLEEQFRALKQMEALYLVLNRRRDKRGALDLDVAESAIVMGPDGEPQDIQRAERGLANRMIEEFMLLANETVAAHAQANALPFLYRVHEQPDPDKLQDFAAFLQSLGYCLKGRKGGQVHPKALQAVLKACQGKPEADVISQVMLRTLQKARYFPNNLGHFGLAAKDYCHFTSPIRRYPDLFVHRVLKAEHAARPLDPYRKGLEEVAKRCSDQERGALEAERDMDDLLKCRYMQRHVGLEAEGVVTGVTGFGLFVTLPNTVEGLVHISGLDDDYYVYDEKNYLLVGERRRKLYRLGQRLRVRVEGVDPSARRVELALCKEQPA